MSKCDKCGGFAFYNDECRDCGFEKEGASEETTNKNEIAKALPSFERTMSSRLHPENSSTNHGEPPQQEFPFLKRK